MSKTTDWAMDAQAAFDAMERIQAERDELAALEWIAKNPNKAIAAGLLVKNQIVLNG